MARAGLSDFEDRAARRGLNSRVAESPVGHRESRGPPSDQEGIKQRRVLSIQEGAELPSGRKGVRQLRERQALMWERLAAACKMYRRAEAPLR